VPSCHPFDHCQNSSEVTVYPCVMVTVVHRHLSARKKITAKKIERRIICRYGVCCGLYVGSGLLVGVSLNFSNFPGF
jgi:hypothetical protein